MAKKRGGLLLMLGALVGAVMALFFSTDEEGETKNAVRAKVKELKIKMKEVKEKEVVQKIFGEKSDEVVAVFREVKDNMVDRLAKVKGSLEAMDKRKYLDVVNEVVDGLKTNSKVSSAQLTKLKKYLAADYKKLKKSSKPKKTKKA